MLTLDCERPSFSKLWNGYFAYYSANLFFILCFFFLSSSLFLLFCIIVLLFSWVIFWFFPAHLAKLEWLQDDCEPTISYCNLNTQHTQSLEGVCSTEQYVSARYQFGTMSVYLNQKSRKWKEITKRRSSEKEHRMELKRRKKFDKIKLISNNCCEKKE